MYERAKYFNIKFNRNGIYGLAISAFLIYFAFKKQEAFSSLLYVYAAMSIAWIVIALWINTKLKLKNASSDVNEISEEKYSFKSVEQILSLLLVIFIILSNKKWEYANYLAIPLIIGYSAWTFFQMRMLNNYFKS